MSIYEYTLEHGVGTFTQKGDPVEPGQGYAVGIHPYTFGRVPEDDPVDFADVIERLRVAYPSSFIGTWLDGEGVIHVDPVAVFNLRKHAEMYAREFNQDSIYNFATGMSEGVV